MIKRLLGLMVILFSTLTLSAQGGGDLSLHLTTGIANYSATTDFQRNLLLQEGNDFNRLSGNISEPTFLPFVRVALSYPLNERWEVSPFVQYMFGKGTLFENDFFRFGVSGTNPEEKTFTRSAPNELKVLTAGISSNYLLVNGPSTKVKSGVGLAYMHRSHTYREYLEVDFSATYDPISVVEEFATVRKGALGIPISISIEQELTDRVSVGLRAETQFHLDLEDTFWASGVSVSVKL